MLNNELYLVVLPMINLGPSFSATQQVLTLLPDKNFATLFFPDEVDQYVLRFKNHLPDMTGGHVIGYLVTKEQQPDGRVIVRVVQNVR